MLDGCARGEASKPSRATSIWKKIPRLSLKKHEKPICPWGEEQGRHKFKPYRYSYHFIYMPNLFSISVTRVLWGLQVTGSWVTGCSGRFWRAVGWVYVRMWSVVSYVDTLYARSSCHVQKKVFRILVPWSTSTDK